MVPRNEAEKPTARDSRVTVAEQSAREGADAASATHDAVVASEGPSTHHDMESAQTSFPVPATASGMAELAEARKFFTPDDDTSD